MFGAPYKYDYLDEEGGVYHANIAHQEFHSIALLLTDSEIEVGLHKAYPEASVTVYNCRHKRICLDLSNLDYDDYRIKGPEFQKSITALLDNLIRHKFSGDRKFQASLDQQEALIRKGIITTEDAPKTNPAALESLLGQDLGL